MEFHIQLIGKLASFGEQFLRNFGDLCAFHFYIYKNVLHSLANNLFV
jgi:hypothetical protein